LVRTNGRIWNDKFVATAWRGLHSFCAAALRENALLLHWRFKNRG
jgi:hypothetical protein